MAVRCRAEILRMTHRAGAGHPGGSLSEIDILVALYSTRLRYDP
ncbi:MAG TPA: transketolase, partial [Candidatus Poseidoniales archaeon]|nr:transketolase [Candidatus Poseidoniales archaeon]